MNAPTQAISSAYGSPNPYGPSRPPHGMPPSAPNGIDPTQGDEGSSLAEEAFKQQLAARQTQQQQNPFKQAWENSVNWLKTHWKLALATVFLLGGGGYLASKNHSIKGLFNGLRFGNNSIKDRVKTSSQQVITALELIEGGSENCFGKAGEKQIMKDLPLYFINHAQAKVSELNQKLRNCQPHEEVALRAQIAEANHVIKIVEEHKQGRNDTPQNFAANLKNKLLDVPWIQSFFGSPESPTPTPTAPTPPPINPTPTPAPRTPSPTPTPPAPPTGFGGE